MNRKTRSTRNALGLEVSTNITSPEELATVLMCGRSLGERKFFDHVGRSARHLGLPESDAFELISRSIDDGVGERGELTLPRECLRIKPGRAGGNCVVRRDVPDRFFHRLLDWCADRSLPPMLDLKSIASPMKDQGGRGTCLAHAACRSMEALRTRAGAFGFDASEQHFYAACKEIDGTPNQSGTTLAASEQVALGEGFIEEKYWPYRPYPDPNGNEGQGPPPDEARSAPRHHPAEVITLPNWLDPEQFLMLLRAFMAGFGREPGESGIIPILVVPCYASMMAARHSGNVPTPLPGERPWGWHALNPTGYDRDTGLYIVDNSWGEWSANPRGSHRLNYHESFFENTKCWAQLLLSEEDVEFLQRFESGAPVYGETDQKKEDAEMDLEPAGGRGPGAERSTAGSLALVCALFALLPLGAIVWTSGTLEVLRFQWWGNLVCSALVFGLAFGSGMLGTSRLALTLVPYAGLATGAALLLGQFLTGGWLVFGTAATVLGIAILIFLFAAVIHSIFSEAGRRLRGLIEESPLLMVIDSLAAILLVAIALVLVVRVIPPFAVHYAEGVREIIATSRALLG